MTKDIRYWLYWFGSCTPMFVAGTQFHRTLPVYMTVVVVAMAVHMFCISRVSNYLATDPQEPSK